MSGVGTAIARLADGDDSGNNQAAIGSTTSVPQTIASVPPSTNVLPNTSVPGSGGPGSTTPLGSVPVSSSEPDALADTGAEEWLQWAGYAMIVAPIGMRRVLKRANS